MTPWRIRRRRHPEIVDGPDMTLAEGLAIEAQQRELVQRWKEEAEERLQRLETAVEIIERRRREKDE